MSYQLLFDCGASFKPACNSFVALAKDQRLPRRGKDGRFRVIVFDSDGTTMPIMADGRHAPCFRCPCHRSAGRTEITATSNDPRLPGRRIVLCHPKEIEVRESATILQMNPKKEVLVHES